MAIDLELDADDQDQAETFDETHITEDGEDIARPDMMRNVFDVTSADDDGDDEDLADEDPDDFDPDALDETEIEALLEEDDGVDDDEGPLTRDEADLVQDDESPSAFEGGDEEDDDERRDEALEETFPASDSPPINPGAD